MVDKNRKVNTALAVVAAGEPVALAYLHQVTETQGLTCLLPDKSINLELRENLTGMDMNLEKKAFSTEQEWMRPIKYNMDLGFNLAQRYTPGTDIPKDPQVKTQ